MGETMPHWLTKQASLAPNQVAIERTNGAVITYDELNQASKTFARKLANYHINPQDKVAILSSNCVEMVVAIHALSYMGATIVMLNTRLSQTELMYQLDRSEAVLLLTTTALQEEKALSFALQVTYEEVANQAEQDIPLQTEIDLDAPFTMMFTSGTTGHPKAVVHTYRNHYASAINSALNLGLQENDKWLLTLPIFHVGGLSIILRSVIYGTQIYFVEKYEADLIYTALMEKGVTIISLVSLMLKELVERLGKETLPSTLRCILLGGGPVPSPLLDVVKEKSLPVFQTYGMTETSSQIVTLQAADVINKIGSAGKPLFAAQLKIDRPDHTGVGEILVKGPMVMEGYYRNEAANQKAFIDGWFKTGDLGYLDIDGYLYVVDRRTDLIISGGENIYPNEIENILLSMPDVTDVAVVGKKDAKWGEVPAAFIVSQTETITSKQVIDFAMNKLAAYKVPKEIYFVASLPRNASNKVMRHQLAAKINV